MSVFTFVTIVVFQVVATIWVFAPFLLFILPIWIEIMLSNTKTITETNRVLSVNISKLNWSILSIDGRRDSNGIRVDSAKLLYFAARNQPSNLKSYGFNENKRNTHIYRSMRSTTKTKSCSMVEKHDPKWHMLMTETTLWCHMKWI